MSEKPSRIRRWIITPITRQMRQGSSPEKLAWSIAVGLTLGIFPILGSTSFLCFFFAWLLKLNQPTAHLFNTLSYPLHIALIIPFISAGQALTGTPPIAFSIPEMIDQFKENPAQFAGDFGLAALHGVGAWAICAIFLVPLTYFAALPLLRKLMRRLSRSAKSKRSKTTSPT